MRLVVRDYRLVHYGAAASPIPGLPPMTEEQAAAFVLLKESLVAMEILDQQAAL